MKHKIPKYFTGRGVILPFTLQSIIIKKNDEIRLFEDINNTHGKKFAIFYNIENTQISPDSQNKTTELEVPHFTVNNHYYSKVCTIARIVKIIKYPDNSIKVMIRGLERGIAVKLDTNEIVIAEYTTDDLNSKHVDSYISNIKDQFVKISNIVSSIPEEMKLSVLNQKNPISIIDSIGDFLSTTYVEKLSILISKSIIQRLKFLSVTLNREVESVCAGKDIQNKVSEALSANQREYYLKEQLKAIHAELGDESSNPDIIHFNKVLDQTVLPVIVYEIIVKELDRLKIITQASPEYYVAYNYIDWLLSVPWDCFSQDCNSLSKAKKILDEDHAGLDDVKNRILQFMAVKKLQKNGKTPILCLVGPPGVGKTSLGNSIARAMNKNFIKIALGGVKDESEIRGHRRTYIGAMPGKIVQALKKAKTINPVIMLDEIDKLCNSAGGDPAAALLEVLDPNQNHNFNDHYLAVDTDLSNVTFITTANIIENIPGPLRDRMEIIMLSGYTNEEKEKIAVDYLVKKQIEGSGLNSEFVTITPNAINEIIQYYTREAGVRELERVLGNVAGKIAKRTVEGLIERDKAFCINKKNIKDYQGERLFYYETASKSPELGTSTGIAYTGYGGTVLSVESTLMPGTGTSELTGSLGQVMQESAKTAFSFVKSNHNKYGIKKEMFFDNDIHIHVPDGATPKDGPSAGVTIAASIISTYTGKKIRPDFAMTGEVTLRGKVTAVGGIKEKTLGALQAGIHNIIIPEQNRKDISSIPSVIKKRVKYHYVSKVDDALKLILVD